ncbi:MAG: HAD-IC family P-type ATPase [Paracoccaceae bacterium]|nr:HAD-IC family P-type ATPase [Paracoccaceae bacterium]
MSDPVHHMTAAQALAMLDAVPEGLSQAEAARRLDRRGPNRLPQARRRGPLRRFLAQFDNVLIYVLLAAAVVTATLQHWIDTAVILAVVLANAVIGFLQEGKAEAAMAAIRVLLAPRASVLRGGRRMSVAGEDLVPGDIVLVEAGDRVPADLRLMQAHGLFVDESMLTGESVPAEKSTRPAPRAAALGDRHSMLWSGTIVTQGSARGVVTATGPETEIGRIGGLLAQVQDLTTPLVAQMDHFSRGLSLTILAACALLFGYAALLGNHDFGALFLLVVGVAVAAIPEGLPAVMTITLAIGVQAMARRKAIVRRLPAIEAIGSVSVICTDKTGTLTRNEMMVTAAETPEGSFQVDGNGYAPQGRITPAGDLSRLARAAALCNDASLARHGGAWRAEGDPMEAALLAFAGKQGAAPHARRLDAIPFDSRHRFMAVLVDAGEEGPLALVKGAPERVLRMCDSVDHDLWHARAEALASQGLRVLALAERPQMARRLDADALDGDLRFLGLLGLIDPPRPEAIAAVADCRAAGIRVKMITGDHAGTARAIARAIGLARPDQVLTGADLDRMDDAGLARAVALADVFARTSPEHKLRLVQAVQAGGHSVAMTGDGVNDAPALKRADVGIAMGQKGSQAAKEAADLVLADDNFATIAAAVREGRTVQDNLRKVISFELPTSAGESATVVLALLLGLALPITAIQILWINLITGITLGLALAFEPTEPGTMARPPRRRDAPLLSGALVWHVVFVSVLFVAVAFGIFAHAQDRGYPLARAQTMTMNMLVVLEIFHLVYIRNLHGTSLTPGMVRGTPVVWAVILLVAGAQAAVTYLPPLQLLLGTQAITLADGALIVGAGVAFLLVLELEKQLRLRLWRATV